MKVSKKNQLLFLLEEDVKNHGIQVIKTTAIGRENEKKKKKKTPILNYFVLKPFQCRIPGSLIIIIIIIIMMMMIFVDLYCANINPGTEIFICALHQLNKILKS